MIQIKPLVDRTYACPECGSAAAVEKVSIPGMNMYAECHCSSCGIAFFHMLPTGHYVNAALSVRKGDHRIYGDNERDYDWLARVVRQAFPLQKANVTIRKKTFRQCRRVVILNTLDFLYGHSLLKLYNAQHHLDHETDTGLLIILPAALEWMVPDGCSEAWIIDLPLRDFVQGYDSIRRYAEGQLERFDEVFLSEAYSHPECINLDIRRFTGIEPFDLGRFNTLTPCFTFVLREDRWWLAHPLHQSIYRMARKLKLLRHGSKILSAQQNRLVKTTIKSIKRIIPNAGFYVLGLGKTGGFQGLANDRRVLSPDSDTEKTWCTIYAKSHVIIGVHGSNMLLPTAFAAGCVEILPSDRYGNMVQDLSVRFPDRRQLFLYRFVEQYTSPLTVAAHAVAIVKNYGLFFRNMCVNTFASDRKTGGERTFHPTNP